MFVLSTKTGIVLLLCLLLGLHWGMLQIVAWTGMVVGYARTAPLKVALLKTFDGKHPCKLCQFIAKAKRAEKKQDTHSSIGKLDPFSAPAAVVFLPPVFENLTAHFTGSAPDRTEPPPTPPPTSELLG